MSFQQHLMRRIWRPLIKREVEVYMVIRGKILSAVRLSDIAKVVECGKDVNLTEYEVNRSRDLQNALNRGWIEIIYDRAMLKRAIAIQGQAKEKVVDSDPMDIAKKMAQTMAEEMIKNSPLVREIAREVAKEMIIEIKENIKVERITTQLQTATENKISIDDPENIFVEFKDEEAGITANINKTSNVEVQKDDLTNSLERMKRFKQAKK